MHGYTLYLKRKLDESAKDGMNAKTFFGNPLQAMDKQLQAYRERFGSGQRPESKPSKAIVMADRADKQSSMADLKREIKQVIRMETAGSESFQDKTRFNDLIGMAAVKDEMEDNFVHAFVYPSMFDQTRKGVLLYGPPGTGKTQVVRAMVNELHARLLEQGTEEHPLADIYFFPASAADLKDAYIGNTEKRVQALFEIATEQVEQNKGRPAYSIIFIDEIESLVGNRSRQQQDSGTSAALSTFLVQMDGFKSLQSVAVIGATNFPCHLDAALRRRLGTQVLVDIPDTLDSVMRLVMKRFHDQLVRLWGNTKPSRLELQVNHTSLATAFPLFGAQVYARQNSQTSAAASAVSAASAPLLLPFNLLWSMSLEQFFGVRDNIKLSTNSLPEQFTTSFQATDAHYNDQQALCGDPDALVHYFASKNYSHDDILKGTAKMIIEAGKFALNEQYCFAPFQPALQVGGDTIPTPENVSYMPVGVSFERSASGEHRGNFSLLPLLIEHSWENSDSPCAIDTEIEVTVDDTPHAYHTKVLIFPPNNRYETRNLGRLKNIVVTNVESSDHAGVCCMVPWQIHVTIIGGKVTKLETKSLYRITATGPDTDIKERRDVFTLTDNKITPTTKHGTSTLDAIKLKRVDKQQRTATGCPASKMSEIRGAMRSFLCAAHRMEACIKNMPATVDAENLKQPRDFHRDPVCAVSS